TRIGPDRSAARCTREILRLMSRPARNWIPGIRGQVIEGLKSTLYGPSPAPSPRSLICSEVLVHRQPILAMLRIYFCHTCVWAAADFVLRRFEHTVLKCPIQHPVCLIFCVKRSRRNITVVMLHRVF